MAPKLAEINNSSEATVLRLNNSVSHTVGGTGERGSIHERDDAPDRFHHDYTLQVGDSCQGAGMS